jgi:hypothetical protein
MTAGGGTGPGRAAAPGPALFPVPGREKTSPARRAGASMPAAARCPGLLLPGPRGPGTASCPGAGLAHAERLSFGDHHDGVVQEAVQEADGGSVLGQEPAPLLEGPVGADAEGAALVGSGDEPEQQLGAGVVEWREPDLVDDDEVGTQDGLDDAADGVVGQPAVERLDELGGGEVADPVAGLDGRDAERDEAVGLAGADGYPRFQLDRAMFSQVASLLRLMRRYFVVEGCGFQPSRVSSRRSSRFSPWACSSAARRAAFSSRCCFLR